MSSTDLASTPQYRMFITLMTLEKFVVMMYSRTTQVGVLRMQGWMTLCLLGNRLYEDIPPCQTATHQHMKCTTLPAGRTWSLYYYQQLAKHKTKCPADWG